MSKHNHEPRYAFNQAKRFLAAPLRVRFVGARVRQQLTYGMTLFTLAALLFAAGGDVWARPLFATAPPLGTATSFAVLAASAVTNTGPTVVTGDLGVSPGIAVTGFPPGIVIGGTIHAGDAIAAQAQADANVAYTNLAGQPCNTTLTGQDLGGQTLTPGVYCFLSSAQLTGILTLDGQGDPSAVFVFQIGSTLTTASAASVLLINGASACNVFWQVGSSATLGTATAFAGNIVALASNTLMTGASVSGRVIALTASVTLDTNTVSGCTGTPSTPTATATNTAVATNTNTLVATNTNTPVATNTNTPVATNTNTPVAPNTNTPIATNTNTPVATNTNTPVATNTNTPVAPNTNTPIATNTNTPVLPTATSTGTPTPKPKPGRVEIDKIFCPSNDGTRTEFQVFPPQGSSPRASVNRSASRSAICETREGIAFTVKNSNGQVVASILTGPGGIVQFELPPGTYTLIEDANGASTTFLVEASNLTAIFVRNFESGEVKLSKLFCASGDSGTIISVNGAPQPKGQNGCQSGNAQFQIDGGPMFAVGSTGIRVFPLLSGSHIIVEVATSARAKFTVKVGQTTTIVVFNFPGATHKGDAGEVRMRDGSMLDDDSQPGLTVTMPYTIFMPLISLQPPISTLMATPVLTSPVTLTGRVEPMGEPSASMTTLYLPFVVR